ncbi:hypothetical protein PInf_015960 [Phytophthora infestans]|nr:hypothetical protein PInf_015960 [Phytophthora infestans]
MTLVLGQPGSGKSSLLKILSISVNGQVTYNGTSQQELCRRLPQLVSFVDQHDKHFPTLTVKETLEFANVCSGDTLSKTEEQLYSNGKPEQNQSALDLLRAMYKHYPGVIIRQLGLENCQNTILGNAMLRGISGGERKRVTTGEMMFGNKFVLMMDEISTGLDSAATFDLISTQRSQAKTLNKTVAISLLQPSPEVFALFDDVILLNDGYVVYHGPRSEALNHFESLGFRCLANRDVADFLLDLGTNKQQQYEVGGCPGSAFELADAFRRSPICNRMRIELNSPLDPSLLVDKKKFMDPIPTTLTRRQMTVTLRNKALIKSRLLMSVLLGLLNGSTFYQLYASDVQVVIGIIYVAINFVTVGQSSQMPIFMDLRDVFNKQRGANFHRTSSFVLAASVSQVPLALMETMIFGSIIYWMCGFVSTVSGFRLWVFGAGKTTLMDVIAGRKTGGQIRGDILLNRHPATDLAIRRATGYCEQMDIHSGASTFREALTFSAFLRQGAEVPDAQKYDSLHGTDEATDYRCGVGSPAQCVVPGRTDEWSGRAFAKLIMDGVRKVADTGRTIVCTIHQPSAVVFRVFDSLLLLKRGGEMVFFGDLGEKASNLVTYFESMDGVSTLEVGNNPATWMLEVIGAGVGNDSSAKMDFVEIFKSSEQYRWLETNLDREGITRPSPSTPALTFGHKRAASSWTQAKFLTKRWFDLYWRAPSFNLTRVIVAVVLAVSLGISYLDTEYVSYQGVNSAWFLAFLLPSLEVASVFMIIVNIICTLFAGFNPPAVSIPRGYKWLHYVIPNKYAFSSLAAIVFGDCSSDGDGSQRGCQQMTGTPPGLPDGMTLKEYLETNFLINTATSGAMSAF